jgi:hypothetical protein
MLLYQYLDSRELCKSAGNLTDVFGSTYTCDVFSREKQKISKFSTRITDVHSYDMLRIGI